MGVLPLTHYLSTVEMREFECRMSGAEAYGRLGREVKGCRVRCGGLGERDRGFFFPFHVAGYGYYWRSLKVVFA